MTTDEYITSYAPGPYETTCRRAPLPLLLAPYYKAKETLSTLLHGELILRQPVSIEKPAEELHQEMERLRCKLPRLPRCICQNELIGNKLTAPLGDYPAGTKALKALRPFFPTPEAYEEFRIEHSRILNDKTLNGNLCLSIDPLDFLTMSDNSYNWSSCMSWVGGGCYRGGTVEMLNSPYVVVAYLEDPAKPQDKKWRTLLVVSPNYLGTIKSYPYASAPLSRLTVSWARSLAKENLGWVYDHYSEDNRTSLPIQTNAMYNDTNRGQTHFQVYNDAPTAYLNISGERTCMWCGQPHALFPNESFVCCEDCLSLNYCDCCGELMNDGYYEINGMLYCSSCYENETLQDDLTGDIVLADEADEHNLLKDGSYVTIWTTVEQGTDEWYYYLEKNNLEEEDEE